MTIFVLVWLFIALLNWGFTLGGFTASFPEHNHVVISFFVALAGPLGIVAVLVTLGLKHFRLVPLSKEERWQSFVAQGGGILGRAYFERNC